MRVRGLSGVRGLPGIRGWSVAFIRGRACGRINNGDRGGVQIFSRCQLFFLQAALFFCAAPFLFLALPLFCLAFFFFDAAAFGFFRGTLKLSFIALNRQNVLVQLIQ